MSRTFKDQPYWVRVKKHGTPTNKNNLSAKRYNSPEYRETRTAVIFSDNVKLIEDIENFINDNSDIYSLDNKYEKFGYFKKKKPNHSPLFSAKHPFIEGLDNYDDYGTIVDHPFVERDEYGDKIHNVNKANLYTVLKITKTVHSKPRYFKGDDYDLTAHQFHKGHFKNYQREEFMEYMLDSFEKDDKDFTKREIRGDFD